MGSIMTDNYSNSNCIFLFFINKKKGRKENTINVKFIKSRETTVIVIRFYVWYELQLLF